MRRTSLTSEGDPTGSRWLWLVVAASLLASSPVGAQTVSCDTNCDDRCRINFGVGNFVEPACKADCEIHKRLACGTGTPVPTPIPPAPGPATCSAEFFDRFNGSVIAMCSNWDGRLDDQHIIQQAVNILTGRGLLAPADFAGVQIRWCGGLRGEGVAPRHSRVYLNPSMKQAHPNALAGLIAHEIHHIRQYRRMGDANFGCTYSRQFVACGGCQDRNHPLEREAYEFEDHVVASLNRFPPPPPPPPPVPPPATRCVVGSRPFDWCNLGVLLPQGARCYCPTNFGPVWGIAR